MVDKANNAGIKVGTIARTKEEICTLGQAGVSYIVYLNDLGILSEAVSGL